MKLERVEAPSLQAGRGYSHAVAIDGPERAENPGAAGEQRPDRAKRGIAHAGAATAANPHGVAAR